MNISTPEPILEDPVVNKRTITGNRLMMIGYSFLEEEWVGGVTEKFLLNCIIVRAIGSQKDLLNVN